MIKKRVKKIMLITLAVILVVVGSVFVAFQVSPIPGAYIIGRLFSGEVEIQNPAYYQQASAKTIVIEDVVYESSYSKNTLDIYYPENYTEAVPVVFWVHGGGFVGGDKSGMKEFANYLVYETNVAVVAINYELAPKLAYPGQVIQLDEAVAFLQAKSEMYPMLDFQKVMFGGDSAGAQISAQYTIIQTNADYAKEMDIKPRVSMESIKGYLSFCGPLDLIQMKDIQTDSFFMNFFMDTVSWSLLETKDWKNSPLLEQVSLTNNLTSDFPNSYITDGNSYSFPDQGISFAQRLEELNVEVETLFFQDTSEEVTHEYQFNFAEKNAKDSLKKTIEFIKKQIEN